MIATSCWTIHCCCLRDQSAVKSPAQSMEHSNKKIVYKCAVSHRPALQSLEAFRSYTSLRIDSATLAVLLSPIATSKRTWYTARGMLGECGEAAARLETCSET